MNKEMQVKSQVLDMLKDFLMGSDGGKFKPKAMTVEVIHAKPGKGGLEEVLQDASEANPVEEEMDHDEPDGDEYCEGGMAEDDEEESPKMSLKEFLKNRS